jgi:hypothetical protein
MKQRQRLTHDVRAEQILIAAIEIARATGYNSITRDGIAEQAGVATGQVNRIYSTMTKLRRSVIRHAIIEIEKGSDESCMFDIVSSGIQQREPAAMNAPAVVKESAFSWLMNQTD